MEKRLKTEFKFVFFNFYVLRTYTPLRFNMMRTASYSAVQLFPTAKTVSPQVEQSPNHVDTWAPSQRPKKML
ncbi:unnamed protein product [Cunninghamella blakesleeana]